MLVAPQDISLGGCNKGCSRPIGSRWPRLAPGLSKSVCTAWVEHRVFYIAKFEEAVYVIHAFEKRTPKTPQSDIQLAQKRFAELVRRRAQKPEVHKP